MPPKIIASTAQYKIKRKCGASLCGEEIRGTDLPRHYRLKTDFKKQNHLKTLRRDAAEKELKYVDTHTAFMFKNNYSLTNLPNWKSHKPVKREAHNIIRLTIHCKV